MLIASSDLDEHFGMENTRSSQVEQARVSCSFFASSTWYEAGGSFVWGLYLYYL
jgi:hypothetical protein